MAKYRTLRSVARDPSSVQLIGPTLTTKAEAWDVMKEIKKQEPKDAIGRPFKYSVTTVL